MAPRRPTIARPLVIKAGGREWRAAQLDPALLRLLSRDLAIIADLNQPLPDRIRSFAHLVGALFLPHHRDLSVEEALKLFVPDHVTAIIDEVGRQARSAKILNELPAKGKA